jgi:hypothetical protein
MIDFELGLKTFLEEAQNKIDENYRDSFPMLSVPKLVVEQGRRYSKIVKVEENNGSRSVFAFIDKDGDVMKPAGWNAPAKAHKGKRGNILSEDKDWLQYLGPYGIQYLR